MDEKEGRGGKAARAKGAALAAAQEAAPFLIKLIAGLLVLLLLIPMLVFTALPNIFFGYDSSTTPEIVDFTASAHGLEAVYQSIDRKNQSIIDRLVESILPNFMTEDVPDYDDYEVEKSLGNVNHYWLIAIGSVRYKQDLNVMDEPTIEKLLSDKDSKKLVEALESGKLVIAIMAPGHFTTTGHFIVLRGITEEGKVLVADPASVKRSNQEWPLRTVVNEAASRAGAGGPFWVFSR